MQSCINKGYYYYYEDMDKKEITNRLRLIVHMSLLFHICVTLAFHIIIQMQCFHTSPVSGPFLQKKRNALIKSLKKL